MNPGSVSFHSAQVLSGIEDFNNEPGLVWAMPLAAISPVR